METKWITQLSPLGVDRQQQIDRHTHNGPCCRSWKRAQLFLLLASISAANHETAGSICVVQPHLSASVLPSWPIDKEQQMSELSAYSCQRQGQGQFMKVKNNYWLKGRRGVLQEPLWSVNVLGWGCCLLVCLLWGDAKTRTDVLDKSSNVTIKQSTIANVLLFLCILLCLCGWLFLTLIWVYSFRSTEVMHRGCSHQLFSQALKCRCRSWCRWIIHE